MKKIILAAILPLFAIWGCDNTTIVDHAYEGTINQNTNVTGPSVDEAVDLGLSVKWAPYNIGATKPSDFGNYYAYGETEPKENYSSGNYTAPANKNTFGNIISTQSDAATAEWGANWRMPSKEEIEELKQCRWETIEDNGVKGVKITGKNGNSIFLPAAGIITESKLFEHNSKGFYRSGDNQSSKLEYFNIPEEKFYGCCIRPVLAIAGEQAKEISIPQESEAIDLGLSVKWAPYNIGASEAWEYGNYYAFGEIEPKTNYTKENYIKPTKRNCDGGLERSESDAAAMKWGGKWRMPLSTEINELFDKCRIDVRTYNNILGFEFTGPNGNSIFLPFSGYCDDYAIIGRGKEMHEYIRTFMDVDTQLKEMIYKGMPFRPVLDTPIPQNESFPIPTKEESIDLGLSVNWAPYNVGAGAVNETGNYYAWGETEIKDRYCEHNWTKPTEFNAEGGISGTIHDVAHIKWGNGWRMPTYEEIEELYTKCIWTEEEIDGMKGYRITSMINNNSIFIPFSGIIKNTGARVLLNEIGYYNSADERKMNYSKFYYIKNTFQGMAVRPVIESGNNDNADIDINIIEVKLENQRNRGFKREWFNDVWQHEIYMESDLIIKFKDGYNDPNITDYGIILYKNDEQIAVLSYNQTGNFSYPFETAITNCTERKEYVTKDYTRVTYEKILPENISVSTPTAGLRITIKGIDKDFILSYNHGRYYASMGKSLKYKTYFKKNVNGNEIYVEGTKMNPLNMEYTRQPSIKLKEFSYKMGDETTGRISYDLHYQIERDGTMFLDTLYSVGAFFTKDSNNKPHFVKKEYLGRQHLADGTLGFVVFSSYDPLHDYVEYDYQASYIEGILRKGNERDTIRTNPILYDFKNNPKWVLTLPEEWPNEFKFWENN